MSNIAIFDIDNTIIKGQTQKELLKFVYKIRLIPLNLYIKVLIWFSLYKFRIVKKPQRIIEYAFSFINNKSVIEISDILNNFFSEKLKPLLFKEAVELIKNYQNRDYRVILISNSVDIIVDKIAKFLNIEEYICTKLEVKNGFYTGKIDGNIIYGHNKILSLEKYIGNSVFDMSWFYTDHDSDIPLLERVEHPVVVNPTTKLKKKAVEKNWPIKYFKQLI